VTLAGQIDWPKFESPFGATFSETTGAPARATRLLVGLHYLKSTFDESDESVVAKWVENPYWPYFCGYTHMQHEWPIHPTPPTKWRQRIGESQLNELLTQTIEVARREQYLPEREVKQATVDTTVQEANVTYPTDSKLLYKAVRKLGRAARRRGIALRQSYVRVGKAAAIKAGRYAPGKQFNRMKREVRKLRTYMGRWIRDIQRKTPANPGQDEALATRFEQCQK
jgi:IS5 family transposase